MPVMKTDIKQELDTSPPPLTPLKYARWLYLGSAVTTLAMLLCIGVIWYRAYAAPFQAYPGEVLMTTGAEIKNYQKSTAISPKTAEAPVYIPTGIVIQSLEFKGPYTIQVAGYVWQRYANNLPELDKGLVFPEAESTTFTQLYRADQGNETLVGWNFKTTLREQFDYARYPLDRQEIRLRMWHVDFEKNVFLEPDVDAYQNLAPDALPGLDPGVILENWQIDRSFFSYRLNKYNANFGIQGYDSSNPQPELYYNISVKRFILSPLVARGIAPLVILIQLFVIVLVIGTDHERLEQFGVRPGAVIFTCAAFFFAILVAQNALRDEIKWYGIVYLETAHVLTYFVILAVAGNSVALVAFPNLGLFRSDNIWVEVFYWPLILLILLVITVFTFQLYVRF